MLIPSAVVLVVDRLSQGFLGPYGNTVIRTPELDALAAESFLFDHALVNDPRLASAYEWLWGLAARDTTPAPGDSRLVRGAPSLAPRDDREDHQPRPSLAAAVASAGVHACLITDEPIVAAHPLAADFAERVLLEAAEHDSAAADVADTAIARLFAAAADWIESARAPFLLWIHARGMSAPWDAPYELRAQYADEEDPAPPDFVAVPDRMLPPDFDPDELLGITQAYSGQISALDASLGMLRAAISDAPLAASTLLCVLSSRGFPLGEHGRVGGDDAPLYGELVEIPWLLRMPDGAGALGRTAALVQHCDLPATLLAWWGVRRTPARGSHDLLPLVREEKDWVRQWAAIAPGGAEQAARTPAWYLRTSHAAHEPRLELFAKPSDRWEVNEVAARAPRICEALAELLAQSATNPPTSGPPTSAPDAAAPLDAALLKPVD